MSKTDWLVIALAVLTISKDTMSAIIATSPEKLGMDPIVMAWIAILAVPVGSATVLIVNQLKALGTPPPRPEK